MYRDIDNILLAHGTGTRLGDAMEMEGIFAEHNSSRKSENPLYISSSKTLLGHCQAAACFVGMICVVSPFIVPELLYQGS